MAPVLTNSHLDRPCAKSVICIAAILLFAERQEKLARRATLQNGRSEGLRHGSLRALQLREGELCSLLRGKRHAKRAESNSFC